MSTALLIMLPPFAACLTLVGIHGYFGIHVLKREIIFIDIAMAQIAALGGTIFSLLPAAVTTDHGIAHYEAQGAGTLAYFISLGLVFLAALIFTLLKSEKLFVSIEAMIGITFAVATTIAVILIDKAAGSDVHVHDMLVGSILWVKWTEILKSLITYSIIGVVHYIFRHKILPISEDYQKAKKSGINVKFWDFFFYFTLGIVVIHSVKIGGILVVFAFLIIPASISILFSDKWSTRIATGWITGTVVTMFGIFFSWVMDVPCGPAVILFLGVALGLALIIKKFNPFGIGKDVEVIPDTAGNVPETG